MNAPVPEFKDTKPITSRLAALARRRPDGVAVVTKDTRISYRDLWLKSEIVAKALIADHPELSSSSRIVLQLHDSCDLACSYVALLRLGLTGILSDSNSGPDTLAHVLQATGATVCITPSEFQSLLTKGKSIGSEAWEVEADPGVILQTSGTTGTPKLMEHSASGIIASFEMLRSGFSDFIRGGPRAIRMASKLLATRPRGILQAAAGRKVWLTSLPLHGVAGFSLFMQALLSGETYVDANGLRASELLGLMRSERVNVVAVSPIMGEMMDRVKEVSRSAFPYLLVIGLGADKPRTDLAERLEHKFGCQVSIGYGSTELGGGVTATSVYRKRPTTSGAVGVPFPGVKVRVVDSQRVPLPNRSIGHIECLVSPLRRGTLVDTAFPQTIGSGDSEAADSDSWVPTGDRGWVDDKNQLYVLGRTDDLIVRGGYKIDPVTIEAVLESHADVAQAAAVAVENQRGTVQIAVHCVTSPGAGFNESDLRALCDKQLPRHARPNYFFHAETLPLTRDGKLRRSDLRMYSKSKIP